MFSSLRPVLALWITLLALASAAEDNAPESGAIQNADSMVQAALQAEVDGDTPRREAYLVRAVEQSPEHPAARWHSGQVCLEDQWMTVEDAEYRLSEKGVIDAYRKLRDIHPGGLAGELALARWCRKHGLQQREKLHWSNSLRFDPTNKEARRRLGVREFRGRLLTAEQIETWKQAKREYDRAMQHWSARLGRWRREIESSPSPYQTEAWKELTSLDDPRAVPSLEQMFPKSEPEVRLQIVEVLGNIREQVATDALVRLAVYAESSEIRQTAATELGNRSWFGFVPNLLGRLETPVECRYLVNTLGTEVFSSIHYSQEQASNIVNLSHSSTIEYRNRYWPVKVQPAKNAERLPFRVAARRAMYEYRRMLELMQAEQVKNTQRRLMNERIYAALSTSTGQQLESQPQSWWQWWAGYNELAASENKPEINLGETHYRETHEILIRFTSCFAAGTPVWTETGPLAIEQVRPGDRVLSQNADSGQLVYRMVLGTTIRPPSPTLRIQVAEEQIVATLGHPLWVVGKGWKMAKELNGGDRLHGVRGGVTIDNIEPGETVEAYNLVVADNNNYFVGKHRLLVHDNMPRRALNLPLPGWSADYH